MARVKTNSSLKKTKIILVVLAVIVCILITAAAKINLPINIPEWTEIFDAAGLRSDLKALEQPISVHFIDVGQGDCIFVRTDDADMLIDAGERGNSETIIRYLRNLNVSELDYVIVSHPDSDHIGSLPEVIEAFNVKNIVMPNINAKNLPSTKVFEKLLLSVQESGAAAIIAKPGSIYQLGKAIITVLGPLSQDADLNNMSVVLRIEYGETSFLLTGDAELEEETEIINNGLAIKSDVLKAGHHGSKSSSNEVFLREVSPEIVIISCGSDNAYDHPHIETLERFKAINARVIRTDKTGTIVLGSDGKQITLYLENEVS